MNDITIKRVNKVVIRHEVKSIDVDRVIVETPLNITLDFHADKDTSPLSLEAYAVMMRTPGNDAELIVGLLKSQGVIQGFQDVVDIQPEHSNQKNDNDWTVLLKGHCLARAKENARQLTAFSSCGICGISYIKAMECLAPPLIDDSSAWLSSSVIHQALTDLSKHQHLFSKTGGAHCAALYSETGSLKALFEDIGRHNALDKLLGYREINQAGESKDFVVISSRISFEMVQKCVMSGISTLIAIGAASSLAITTAQRFGITLIAFARVDVFNVYHGDFRLTDTR